MRQPGDFASHTLRTLPKTPARRLLFLCCLSQKSYFQIFIYWLFVSPGGIVIQSFLRDSQLVEVLNERSYFLVRCFMTPSPLFECVLHDLDWITANKNLQ